MLLGKKTQKSINAFVRLCFCLWFCFAFAQASEVEKKLAISGIDTSALVKYPDQGISTAALNDMVDQWLGDNSQAYTLEQLSLFADDIAKLYKDAGYKFHTVYLPPQKVSNDKPVKLAMLEATLGDVNVIGTDTELNQAIDQLFANYLDQPLFQPDIDNIILALRSKYGIDIFSYYSRGSAKGQIRLNIKASRTASWAGTLSFDNFGSNSTGEERTTLIGSKYDVSGRFDIISLGVQHAVDGETNTYGFLSYQSPLHNLDHSIGFNVSNNQFEVGEGFEALALEGDATLAGLEYRYVFTRSFDQQQTFLVRLDYKKNDYDSLFDDPLLEEDEISQSATFAWSMSYRQIASAWSYGIYASFTGGEYELENIGLKSSFYKGYASQRLEWALGSATDIWFSTFKWVLTGQYAEEKLTSFELIPLSGAYGVRSAEAGYFGADRGGLTHLEWWWPSLLPRSNSVDIAPFLYFDAAYGDRLDLSDNYSTHVSIRGYGLGLQAEFGNNIVLSASTSLDLHSDAGENPEPEEMDFLVRASVMLP